MKTISFISPSRINLSFLKWMYNSIRKNLGYIHEILLADDASTDGTWEWLQNIQKTDPNIKIYRNDTGERQGIVYWYDYLCEKASNDVRYHHRDEGLNTFYLDWMDLDDGDEMIHICCECK